MKKAIASGLIGLLALSGSAVVAAPAFAQAADTEAESTERVERTPLTAEERAERQAEREAHRAEKQALLADLLGVSVDDLQAAWEAGDSLADVAAAQGVDVQVLIDAVVADKQANLDERVADGSIDADRAAEMSTNIEDRVTARINGEPGERGERGHRGHHGPRGGGAPAA